MEFFANIVRSCRMKRMKKELDRLPTSILQISACHALGCSSVILD